MLLDHRPNQDEANNEIDDWLSSGLQSYVEEGQRVRDAADCISPARTSSVQRGTMHALDRYGEGSHSLPPERRIRTPSEPNRDNDADNPPRTHERLRNAQVNRPVIINGEGHNIHINCGPGQQNVHHSESRDERNHYDDEGYGDGGYSDDGYDTDYGYGDDEENYEDYDAGYQQSWRRRYARDNGRFHGEYGSHTRGRHTPYCECRDCQPDLTPDGSSSSGYSDHW
ncbi:hypothetical protein AG0111_0g1647 [Alternaria gaisen]|uniref:Uncharacterized protein n=1 Tax=Alternaria gaisen TaxID=167740 RepID=A0ACB6G164_9PLEO|nr:hypothetical protein AG0111_0g1647 [Alternaria gaisen]